MKKEIADKPEKKGRTLIFLFFALLLMGLAYLTFYLSKSWIYAAMLVGFVIVLGIAYKIISKNLKKSASIKKIEEVFPDFLQLMASNLRAGMTIDRAMLLSSREEFAPLDKEVLRTGKDIATGKSLEFSLLGMSERVKSEKIQKVLILIITGIRAGGNLAKLLEETAVSMREKDFVDKKASSNVLMYIIFIFIAVAVGAPTLFALSTILVETLTKLLTGIPQVNTSQMNMPFTLSSINISIDFVIFFCIGFIIVLDVLASLVLGLISKGEEKQGLKYLLPILVISLGIFFVARIFLSGFLGGFFN